MTECEHTLPLGWPCGLLSSNKSSLWHRALKQHAPAPQHWSRNVSEQNSCKNQNGQEKPFFLNLTVRNSEMTWAEFSLRQVPGTENFHLKLQESDKRPTENVHDKAIVHLRDTILYLYIGMNVVSSPKIPSSKIMQIMENARVWVSQTAASTAGK